VERPAVAELLAALAYGERLAADRARAAVRLAPDERRRREQERIADREQRNTDLLEARLAEVGSLELEERFRPFFDTFFERTEPADWPEAQAFQYVGDALVSDFAETLEGLLDPVSAEIMRHTIGERDAQESFALEELTRAIEPDPAAGDRMAAYSRRIAGEALTQTRRALDHSAVLGELLGGKAGQKELVLALLERHRARLDRLGIEPLDVDPGDDY
jgi:hypothetical protein